MRIVVLFGLGFYLFAASTACTHNQMDPPEVLLTDSMLVKILADGYILNAAFNQTSGTVKDSISKAYSQQITEKYQVSQEVMDENIRWLYAQNRIDTIFQMMLDRMDYLEDRISAEKDPSR